MVEYIVHEYLAYKCIEYSASFGTQSVRVEMAFHSNRLN